VLGCRVIDDDLESLLRFRRPVRGEYRASDSRDSAFRLLAEIRALHLPFGGRIWVVGEIPAGG